MGWVQHFFGFDNPSGTPYLAWSGAGGLILGWLAAAALFLRHTNCHHHGCWRPGRHLEDAGRFRWCRPHLPPLPPPRPVTDSMGELLHELRGLRGDISGLAEAIRVTRR